MAHMSSFRSTKRKYDTSKSPVQKTETFLDTPAGISFSEIWNNPKFQSIPIQNDWFIDEIGNAVFNKPVLFPGEIVKSKTPNGQRFIFVGTRFGNVTIFDRYPEQVKNGVYLKIVPSCRVCFFLLGTSGEASDKDISLAFNLNIGLAIESMAKELQDKP